MIRYSDPGRDLALAAPLIEHAVRREPMKANASGAVLERLYFDDGRALVAKHIAPALDWMMAATRDTGRAAELWVSGTMERCPPQIDAAIVRIEDDGADGWRIYMEDVSSLFARRGTVISRADAVRVLEATAALHAEYWGEEVPGLCTLEDLLALLSPRTLAVHDSEFLSHVRRGWDVFAELAPTDVRDAVFALLDDPRPLAAALLRTGTTLVHSDVHFGNTALASDRVVLLDWSLSAQAPPAVDFTWFLDQSIAMIDATHDELVAEFLRLEEGRVTPEALDLALLAELLSSGWQAAEWIDAESRPQREASFAWFVNRARHALAAGL